MSAELVLVAPDAASGSLIPITTGRNVAIKPKPSRKRNAGGNRRMAPRRVRNASDSSPRPSRAAAESTKSAEEVANERLAKVVQPHRLGQSVVTAISSALSSAAGVGLCRFGISPWWSSAIVGGAGVLVNSYAQRDLWRTAATGATGAGASQLGLQLLQLMFPGLVQRERVVVVQQQPPAPAQPALPAPAPAPTSAKPRGADLEIEALKPGSLDAAFERARAELAVEANGFPEGFLPNQHTRLVNYHQVANDSHLHESPAHPSANDNHWHIDGESHAVTR